MVNGLMKEFDERINPNEISAPFILNGKTYQVKNLEGKDYQQILQIENGKSTLYYDVKTGLKVMSSTTAERNGQKMTSTISYTDYKEVKGIKIPHNIVMSQGRDIEIKVTDVKINEGVTDADFQ
jgi:saccharopine dehydrogenase-like NADP-dependent oxidoreductase